MREPNYSFVFVYGTLRTGYGLNHRLVKDCGGLLVGPAFVHGFDCYCLGRFPAMVRGIGTVHGELWRVKSDSLPILDRIEGTPYLYQRESVRCVAPGCIEVETFAYVFHHSTKGMRQIADGRWAPLPEGTTWKPENEGPATWAPPFPLAETRGLPPEGPAFQRESARDARRVRRLYREGHVPGSGMAD